MGVLHADKSVFTCIDFCLWPCGCSANWSHGCAVLLPTGTEQSWAPLVFSHFLLLMGTHKSGVMFFLMSCGGGVHRGPEKGTTGAGSVSANYKVLHVHTYTKLLLFLCSELSLCCLFSSMEWEVAPKPLSPPLWTPECIRPRLLMKMKMRMKSHLPLVGSNVASLRGESLVETRLWSLTNPTEPLPHFTHSCPHIAHVASLCSPISFQLLLPPAAKCHQKGLGDNRERQKSTTRLPR